MTASPVSEVAADILKIANLFYYLGIFTGFLLGACLGRPLGRFIDRFLDLVWDVCFERRAWVRKFRERAGLAGCDYCRQFDEKEADNG